MLPTLSSLSVSKSPVGRLRHRCSSEYLRISPLHSEFRQPLLHSRKTVSTAVHGLSPGISQLTCFPACAPFTPSNSGQRLPPTYYRGCWHVVSRGLLLSYRHCSSLRTEVYNPKTVFLHAALLHQACAHCAIFPTAASRRSLGRVSVPMWPFNLSVRLLIVDLVGRYPTNYLIRREAILRRKSFGILMMSSKYIMRYYRPFPDAIPLRRAGSSRVTHPSATQSYLISSEESIVKLRSTCMC